MTNSPTNTYHIKTERQTEKEYWAAIAAWNNIVREALRKTDNPEDTKLWLSMFI